METVPASCTMQKAIRAKNLSKMIRRQIQTGQKAIARVKGQCAHNERLSKITVTHVPTIFGWGRVGDHNVSSDQTTKQITEEHVKVRIPQSAIKPTEHKVQGATTPSISGHIGT